MLQAVYVPQNHFGNSAYKKEVIQTAIFNPHRDPIIALIAVKEVKLIEMKEIATWLNALLRTYSVPYNLILNIIAIFMIKLTVELYATSNKDKVAADLAFEIFKKGGNASLLGTTPGYTVNSSIGPYAPYLNFSARRRSGGLV